MANKIEMQELEFMLAKEYKEGMNIPREFKGKKYAPEDWLMSEKKDGLRARYNPDTKGFVSRNNKCLIYLEGNSSKKAGPVWLWHHYLPW